MHISVPSLVYTENSRPKPTTPKKNPKSSADGAGDNGEVGVIGIFA